MAAHVFCYSNDFIAMTETSTRLSPSEITRVRITYPCCDAVAEVPIQKAKLIITTDSCPHCNTDISDSDDRDLFRELQNVMTKLRSKEDKLGIQLVYEDKVTK